MHEHSLVRNILRQVEEIRRQYNAPLVSEVRVELGPLSGAEPLLLTSAFELLKSTTSAAHAKLAIDEVQLMAECEPCNRQFEVDDLVFLCPTCQGNVKVIRGDEVFLVGISFPEVAAATIDTLS